MPEILRQYGVTVMPLSAVVDDFCLAQGNMKQTQIAAQYRHARWAWKELFRTTLWFVNKKQLFVDKTTHTIKLPSDCERVLNVQFVDCYGIYHPLGFNPNINTLPLYEEEKKCSCDKCDGSEDTLCAMLDDIKMTTETIELNGTDYTKTTWVRYSEGGQIQESTHTPYWNPETDAVEYIDEIRTICEVETNSNGCICNTEKNKELLRTHCGCTDFVNAWRWSVRRHNPNAYREIIPANYNYYGYWNWDAKKGDIIHIFNPWRLNRPLTEAEEANIENLRGTISSVVLDYQTNGETAEQEILIPEYAVEAIQIGMVYRQKYLNTRVSEGEKREAKYAKDDAFKQVFLRLNPIRIEDAAKLQTRRRNW